MKEETCVFLPLVLKISKTLFICYLYYLKHVILISSKPYSTSFYPTVVVKTHISEVPFYILLTFSLLQVWSS